MPLACGRGTATPMVKTVGVFEVYGDGVTLQGELTDVRGFSKVEVWFHVDDLGDTPRVTYMATDNFSYRVTNLDRSTTYTLCACAEGDNGKNGHGEDMDFNISEVTHQG